MMIIPLLLAVIVLTNAVPFRQYIQKYNSEIVPINENLERDKREVFDGYYARNLFDDGADYDSGNGYESDRYDAPAKPQRYHYNPVVKYVEQRHKRHKFFVPNLWG